METHLFVYGSLMTSAAHPMGERLRKEARLLGEGAIAGRLYRVSWYPGAVDADGPDQLVHGEVYGLESPAATLRWLDAYEGIREDGNPPSEYHRVQRAVRLACGGEVSAWVYLLQRPVGELQAVPGGRWVPAAK
jgi:gamma-glutamylcyclotransferase (GGCT)/AIG2-like uncharacterized protein YtfP